MTITHAANRQPSSAYQGQALWRRPHWWVWFGLGMLLSLHLAVGVPMLCLVHCLIHPASAHGLHQHTSLQRAAPLCGAHSGPAHGAGGTLHTAPPAVYPAVLLPLLSLIVRPAALVYPAIAAPAPAQWDGELLLPPPRQAR